MAYTKNFNGDYIIRLNIGINNLIGIQDKVALLIYKDKSEDLILFVISKFNNVRDDKQCTNAGFNVNDL